MLVYGDHERRLDPRDALERLREAIRARPAGDPHEHHAALVAALLEAGEITQGLLDDESASTELDDATPLAAACGALLQALATDVRASFLSREPPRHDAMACVTALLAHALPQRITAKLPEGFAFYAVYPEAHAAAASALPGDDVRVLGIRSIGTVLAAMASAGAGARRPSWTVRPRGHPFARTLRASDRLRDELVSNAREATFAIADEGPGLSGSSFACVASFLESSGVARERIHFLPSHAGEPGAAAKPEVRARWREAPRHVASFEELVLPRVQRAAESITGAALAPLEDVSAGRWREHLSDASTWPPAHAQQERRKYLLRSASGTYLLKFAGLGRHGERAYRRSRELADAGFAPPALALRHGFLVQPWLDARPLDAARVERAALVARVADYLAFREQRFVADASGASPGKLLEMARYNASRALGEDAGEAFARWADAPDSMRGALRPIETDNRLHAWEWLVTSDGRLLKCDGVDHCRAHDLVGCQDVAWDLAGAAIELSLTPDEHARLLERFSRATGRRLEPRVLGFFRAAYLAFQLGHHAMAADLHDGFDPAEAARFRRRASLYAAALASPPGR